uniref:Uncharacterized protein n=1 Tax=Sus scrofa TaxID=9823 RepID=A0A4X1W6M6_PIG
MRKVRLTGKERNTCWEWHKILHLPQALLSANFSSSVFWLRLRRVCFPPRWRSSPPGSRHSLRTGSCLFVQEASQALSGRAWGNLRSARHLPRLAWVRPHTHPPPPQMSLWRRAPQTWEGPPLPSCPGTGSWCAG